MNSEKFPVTCERFITYFDIMGFKDFSYRSSHQEVEKLMLTISNSIEDIKRTELKLLTKKKADQDFEKAIIMPVVFSDTILLISGSNTIYDARKIAYATSFLLYRMFLNEIPVKGALSYGLVTSNLRKSIYFGRPLIDAYLLANETYFYGAILHHSFEKYLTENNSFLPEVILKEKKVPMKGGNIRHFYIDWEVHSNDTLKDNELFKQFYLSVSGTTRKYVDNTFSIYSE